MGSGEKSPIESDEIRKTPFFYTDGGGIKIYARSYPTIELVEVARGNRLYLRSEAGEDVMDYSLAGSSASMDAMITCSDAIKQSGNPFN